MKKTFFVLLLAFFFVWCTDSSDTSQTIELESAESPIEQQDSLQEQWQDLEQKATDDTTQAKQVQETQQATQEQEVTQTQDNTTEVELEAAPIEQDTESEQELVDNFENELNGLIDDLLWEESTDAN